LQDISLRTITNKKVGRPKVLKSEAKTVLRGALFAPDEAKTIDQAVKASGRDKSKWLRETAIISAEQWERPALASDIFWGSLPYPVKEMDGKTLEFKLIIKYPDQKDLMISSGLGTMRIRQRPDGFHIRIFAPYSKEREKVIDLLAAQAKLIKRQPQNSPADYSLEAVPL
jgi:hypothetical protein